MAAPDSPKQAKKVVWDLPVELLNLLSQPFPASIQHLTIKPLNFPATAVKQPVVTKIPSSDPFMDAMTAVSNLTTTDKGGVALKTTNSPLVDLFFEFTPGVKPKRLFDLLHQAWSNDAAV